MVISNLISKRCQRGFDWDHQTLKSFYWMATLKLVKKKRKIDLQLLYHHSKLVLIVESITRSSWNMDNVRGVIRLVVSMALVGESMTTAESKKVSSIKQHLEKYILDGGSSTMVRMIQGGSRTKTMRIPSMGMLNDMIKKVT